MTPFSPAVAAAVSLMGFAGGLTMLGIQRDAE
jgi:hypothetical protein